MSAKQHISGHNFLCAYSLPATGLSTFVVSLFIPTLIPSPTQLRIITPFLEPHNCLDPSSFVSSLQLLCIKSHLCKLDSLFSTCIKQMNLPKTKTKLPGNILTDLYLSLCAQISMWPFVLLGVMLLYPPSSPKMTISFLLFSSFQTSSIFLLPNWW